MPREIPDCPSFPVVQIAGIKHTLGPCGLGGDLGSFLWPAVVARGMIKWSDGGASAALLDYVEEWWPEEPCPVELSIYGEDGDSWPRWPKRGVVPDEELLVLYPEDKEDLKLLLAWEKRREKRSSALEQVSRAITEMGRLRVMQVLQEVKEDLDRVSPGFVAAVVKTHCQDGHSCSMPEHWIK